MEGREQNNEKMVKRRMKEVGRERLREDDSATRVKEKKRGQDG